MCIGYNPFKWADNFESLEEMLEIKENENDEETRINTEGRNRTASNAGSESKQSA